ncbi:class I SAM-dependent methyltransferase [Methanoregula formicica]|uniref:Methylase involved in ubiquinone/menaquinone biosynthesis n=1 Tax=Methanoregula formicica (strain DSM 22288 / NBRC 105244 / SMSP) TaxID=593750 RepID=L0HEI1_METFS|nr:class I SAM-dependent methyltransferase [Methanoregula formicica]AGB01514.1 methylase involved in ubiquinone/menaquinone biosynthesis [Methanoregula formicica SMSP]
MTDRAKIDEYWEMPNTVSLLDKNLRKLETDFVLSHLSSNDELADLGCGGGESTIHYAKKVKSCLALEHSNQLRSIAKKRFKSEKLKNISLVDGDILDLSAYSGKFNVVVTQRVLINFLSWDEQKQIIDNIWSTLRPGGRYIMVENTFEGFEELNAVRRGVNLPNIPLHDWHNYFLHYDKFIDYIEDKFVIETTHTFNLYYLLTRVFLNMFANFEGYGSLAKKDRIFDIADVAARELHEKYGNKITIQVNKGDSFGPIQGFVLRRMG